jgi:DNA polymerase III delta prime subunit
MWEAPERGRLTATTEELSKLLRATNGDFTQFLNDLKRHKFGDVTIRDNEVTLINRRMFREQKDKENHILRQKKYRTKQKSDKEMTPPSSSSSPSPTPIQKKIYKRKVLSDDEFLASLKEKFTWIDWEQTMIKMDAWLMANPGRKKTRRFIVNWINKIEKPLKIKSNIEGDYPRARDVLKKQGIEY